MATTRPKALRIPDDLWQAALKRARTEGTTVTEAVVRFLRWWVSGPPQE